MTVSTPLGQVLRDADGMRLEFLRTGARDVGGLLPRTAGRVRAAAMRAGRALMFLAALAAARVPRRG
ncbi:MAG: hypothetical protein M3P96_15115 [Actinomycetota bacterium]|nr:hypothetical protein [Actinomycetota bacterium]